MIKEIILKNFKCFPDACLELDQMTILAGANAVGKSSIVQAILLASNADNIDFMIHGIFQVNFFGNKVWITTSHACAK